MEFLENNNAETREESVQRYFSELYNQEFSKITKANGKEFITIYSECDITKENKIKILNESIHFFESMEEYEKCGKLLKIMKTIQNGTK